MIYFVQETDNPHGLIKISHTTNIEKRLSALQIGSPVRLSILNVIENENDDLLYHIRFSSSWVRGEWFNPTEELINFIKSLPNTQYINLACQTSFSAAPKKRRENLIKNKSRKMRFDKERSRGILKVGFRPKKQKLRIKRDKLLCELKSFPDASV